MQIAYGVKEANQTKKNKTSKKRMWISKKKMQTSKKILFTINGRKSKIVFISSSSVLFCPFFCITEQLLLPQQMPRERAAVSSTRLLYFKDHPGDQEWLLQDMSMSTNTIIRFVLAKHLAPQAAMRAKDVAQRDGQQGIFTQQVYSTTVWLTFLSSAGHKADLKLDGNKHLHQSWSISQSVIYPLFIYWLYLQDHPDINLLPHLLIHFLPHK